MADETTLAKSNGTSLVQHTGDVLQAIDCMREKQQVSFPQEWWVALQYAALLHDLGKIDPVFQAMLKREKIENSPEIPHGLLSLFFINPTAFSFPENQIVKAVLSAVAFHHWRESFPDLMMGHRASEIKEKAESVLISREQWEEHANRLLDELHILIDKYQLSPGVIGINETFIEYLCYNNLGSAGILTPPYTLVFLPEQIRSSVRQDDWEKLRIFITGNLMRADHFASLVEDDRSSCNIIDVEWGHPLSFEKFDSILAERFGCTDYWQKSFFTDKKELRGDNLILIAPTGFGKTEFSYIWGAGKKNFFILPMQAAVNKIWDRTRKHMENEESVALLHGNAAIELYSRSKNELQLETEGEQRKALDMARHLAKPYLIATADQIAPAALRYPGYERILSSLMNSVLVIDEVQAYDPNAAAIVTHLIQQVNSMGGKTLLMTATLPPFILREIVRRMGLEQRHVIRLIDEQNFEQIASASRHRMRFLVHGGDYASVTEEIIDAAVCQNQKVLVVMNTVSAACTIFERVRDGLHDRKQDINTLLLHSRFTQFQRKEIEQLAVDKYLPNETDRDNTPCIVIATQIVEASLDIDADIIFTEPAPADSLVQRMGRVFRRYARSTSDNSPQNANVVLIIDSSKNKGDDLQLASGIGSVYDRDLTALSLVIILAAIDGVLTLDRKDLKLDTEFLKNAPWLQCFRLRKGSKKKAYPNRHLCELIINNNGKSIVLSERQKLNWVSYSYMALEEGRNLDFPINLGKHLEKYYENLSTLDHGYCSDRKRDAMRLFRNISNITGIPRDMVEQFYKEAREWVIMSNGKLNYLQLATDILPRFTVSCPYNIATRRDQALTQLDIDHIVDPNTNYKTRDKLERWLSNLYVLELSYHPQKGLIYE